MKRGGMEFGFGRLPGELAKRWPKDAEGEYVPPVFLKHCASTDLEDEFLINMLEAYGVPVLRAHAGDGSFGKVILGISGTGSELYVPEPLYETAKDLMEAEIDMTEGEYD